MLKQVAKYALVAITLLLWFSLIVLVVASFLTLIFRFDGLSLHNAILSGLKWSVIFCLTMVVSNTVISALIRTANRRGWFKGRPRLATAVFYGAPWISNLGIFLAFYLYFIASRGSLLLGICFVGGFAVIATADYRKKMDAKYLDALKRRDGRDLRTTTSLWTNKSPWAK